MVDIVFRQEMVQNIFLMTIIVHFFISQVFTIVRNVYIDGVFDLCHIGHKMHIQRALDYGNRVIVGVMSDDDVLKYKREPVMTLEERVREIAALRCLHQGYKKCFFATNNVF